MNTGEDESAIRAELAKAQENVTTKVKSVRHHEEDDLVVESYEEAPVQEEMSGGDFTENETQYGEGTEFVNQQPEETTVYMGTETDPNKEES